MSADRIATVTPVAEAGAPARVAAVYADIKAVKKIDFVPNLWRVLATNVDQLEMTWARVRSVMHPETVGRPTQLTPLIREAIAVAVSATNGCRYCVNTHTAALRKLGVDPATLGEILEVAALFNATNMLADGYQIEPDILPPPA